MNFIIAKVSITSLNLHYLLQRHQHKIWESISNAIDKAEKQRLEEMRFYRVKGIETEILK